MTSRQYDVIDEKVAAEIKRLKKDHPNLGHEGLMDALSQQGIQLDEAQCKEYVRKHKLAPGVVQQSWGWVASRWIPPFSLFTRGPPRNRAFRRFFWRRRHD